MGMLVEGKWVDQWYDAKSTGGKFVRKASSFRNWIGEGDFKAEEDRYHLYVSLACPWAHRTLIFRHLKGLEDLISISVVHPHMLENGWHFGTDFEETTGDALFGSKYLYENYVRADSTYTGRVTVPVLWDKQQNTIVNNESAEIIRMFNSAFNMLTGNTDDYYPKELREEIDALNQHIYTNVNNGVYKAGFATTQQAYEEGVRPLFQALDQLDQRLQKEGPYLFGETVSEADWRLFTTLIRFDPVYFGHFKCNLKRIKDYPALAQYVKRLYDFKDVQGTVNFEHIKHHYYYSHDQINPTRVVPLGPEDNLPA